MSGLKRRSRSDISERPSGLELQSRVLLARQIADKTRDEIGLNDVIDWRISLARKHLSDGLNGREQLLLGRSMREYDLNDLFEGQVRGGLRVCRLCRGRCRSAEVRFIVQWRLVFGVSDVSSLQDLVFFLLFAQLNARFGSATTQILELERYSTLNS